jgi:hypothetical protein
VNQNGTHAFITPLGTIVHSASCRIEIILDETIAKGVSLCHPANYSTVRLLLSAILRYSSVSYIDSLISSHLARTPQPGAYLHCRLGM